MDLSDFEEDLKYPGSKNVRKSALKKPAPPPVHQEETGWDSKPLRRTIRDTAGQVLTIEFFPILALSRALQKRPTTIRAWIDKGWLPEARYRDKPRHSIKGEEKGPRLWTRSQIEAIVTIAKEEGILDGKYAKNIKESQFTPRVRQYFREHKV